MESYTEPLHGEEFALANTDLQIKLYKGNWTGGANLIDTADDGHGNPLVGNNSSGLNQSMERNNIPGDGTLSASWHTCVSGDANSLSYWDAIGNNYGTPGAANLSSVVMNEFIVNPAGGGDQWVELYNLLDEDFDVSGWYFKNNDGDKIIISESNTESGKTTVPGKGMLVVNLGKDFLDSSKDTLSFYDDMKTADDEDDDVREDVYKYENSTKEAGDSFMRVPDGIGIWIDPEATPGEKNKLTDKESDGFRLLAYDKCFDGEKLKKKNKDEICAPIFLQYIDMIKDVDDEKIKDSTLIKILEVKKTDEEKKLADLLKESEVISAETPILPETKPEEQEKVVTQEPIIDNSIKNENEGQI